MRIVGACAEKVRSSTLDDEKYNWPYNAYIGEIVPIDMTCVVVTALCNQPEAFTSDLADD